MNLRWKIAQYFEFKWWKSYLRNKNKAEYLDWKKSYWTSFLNELEIEIPHNSTCADIGCGPAGIFTVIKAKTDAFDPLIHKYHELNHFDIKNYPEVNFITDCLENIRIDKKYDYIFCINAINHVSDIEKCISVLENMMHDNTVLILSTDYHKYNFLKYLFRLIPGDILHPIQGNLNDFKRIFTSNKLKTDNLILKSQNAIFNYAIFLMKRG